MLQLKNVRVLVALSIFYTISLLTPPARAEAVRSDRNALDMDKLQKVAAQRALLLGIPQHIRVVVGPNSKMVISVEHDSEADEYRVLIDPKFMEQLNDEDIVTAISHELGHVWIFTHHPFLQT